MWNRLPRTASLLALTVALGGTSACGDEETAMQPVVFGSAPPAGTKLPISAPAGTVVPAGSWPRACGFLTDDEITALLPQADRIERVPNEIDVVSILDKSQNQTAAEGGCRYRFRLKDATIDEVTSSVTVSVAAVADPALIEEHYAGQSGKERARPDRPRFEDHADRLGPQACYSWLYAEAEFHLVCRQGPLMYEVTGAGYGTFPGVPTGLEPEAQHWRDKVLAPVAHLVAGKVP